MTQKLNATEKIVGGLSRGEEEEAAASAAASFVCRGAKKLEIALLTHPIRNRNLHKTEKNK
jgi:lipid A disaccharide synthetase